MSNRVFIPGFGLKSSSYISLDPNENDLCIEIDKNLSFDTTIDDIANNIVAKSTVIGYSMGARLALGLALKHPDLVNGLVLISVHAGIEGKEKEIRIKQDQEMAELAIDNPKKMYETLDAKSVFTELHNDYDLNEHRIYDNKILNNQLTNLGLGSSPYMEDRLLELKIPVLYISGSRDPKYVELANRYKKKTAFAHHRILDSDHRVIANAPKTLNFTIDWFTSLF